MWFKKGTSLSYHLNEYQGILDQMLGMDIKFEDEILGMLLLNSLPESWGTFKVFVTNSALNDVVSLQMAKGNVFNEEMRRKAQGSSSRFEVLATENRREVRKREEKEHKGVTLRKEFFTSYTSGDFGALKMSNDGVTKVERQSGKKVKCIRSDNDGGYCGPFDVYCKQQSIKHEKTPPKTPKFNGLAKRMNKTLIERVRCMLSEAKLPNRDVQFMEDQTIEDIDKKQSSTKYPSDEYVTLTDGEEPKCYQEAMESEERQKWLNAIQDEIKSLHDNHTYDLVKFPKGKKVLENRWIYRVSEKEDYVCRLRKSLYGLKHAPRQRYKKFEFVMCEQDYKKTTFDHYVFVRRFSDDDFIILLLYVDDMLIVGKNVSEIDKLKKQLNGSFTMKDIRVAKQILGIRVICDRQAKKLWLSQEHNVKKVLQRFHMENVKVVSTPLTTHFKLSSRHSPSNEAEKTNMSRVPYASIVGSLMYAMVCTRLDICEMDLEDKYLLFYDNQSAIHLGKNSTFHFRSKHIDVRCHWIHDALDAKLLELAKVHTDENGVNMMTKALPRGKFDILIS
ncbi:hypothetical protein CR513_37392, partial [Mucuna pruriens]